MVGIESTQIEKNDIETNQREGDQKVGEQQIAYIVHLDCTSHHYSNTLQLVAW